MIGPAQDPQLFRFGDAAAVVTSVSATTIEAIVPAHKHGGVNVVVTNPDGQSSTLPGGFTYKDHYSIFP